MTLLFLAPGLSLVIKGDMCKSGYGDSLKGPRTALYFTSSSKYALTSGI